MEDQLYLLTGAYALNSLGDSERAAVERHALRTQSSLEEIRGLSETAAMLAYGTPAVVPPPELKNSIMAAIRTTPQLPADAVIQDLASARRRREAGSGRSGRPAAGAARDSGRTVPTRWLGAAAAVFLITSASLGGWAVGLQNEKNEAQARLAAAEEQQTAVLQLFAAPDSRVRPVEMPDGSVVTIAHSTAADRAAVITHNLPPLPEGQTYELWYVTASNEMTPAGFIPAGSAGTTWTLMQGDLSGHTHVGITVEPAGGSPQPTSDPIMVEPLI